MKIFITRKIPDVGVQLLQEAGYTVTQHEDKELLNQSQLIECLQDYDALLSVGPNKIDAHFLHECRHLKGIALYAVGYDNVDMAAATVQHMPIGNTPGVLSGATADTAFLLMLAVSRKAFYMHNRIFNGKWGIYEPVANLGQELNGKTLGIFGLGRIGMALARKCAAAYHMKIIYHNRSRKEEAEKELGAMYVSFEELLQQSDVLSVHANLTAETKGLFNIHAFNKMRKNAIFINTARGGIHHEEDLTKALQQGIIWGAGLDVTNPEPMHKDNVLLTMPNVCVLPHIGSATVETRNAMAIMAANNLIAALQGKPMPNPIDNG